MQPPPLAGGPERSRRREDLPSSQGTGTGLPYEAFAKQGEGTPLPLGTPADLKYLRHYTIEITHDLAVGEPNNIVPLRH